MDNEEIQTMAFALMLRKFPILFSEIRQTRKRKNFALETLKKLYEETFGRNTSCSELMTKIDNMKMRVQEKIDLIRGGNDKMILQSWEITIVNLMYGTKNNFLKMPGVSWNSLSVDDEFEQGISKKVKHSDPLDAYETEETTQLSNEQLKRYFLLQQLRVLKLKERKLKIFLNEGI